MAVSKCASKTTNKGKMQEANSIRCKYVLFLRMLDQEFLSKLPAALIFVREPPVCCVIAQLCSCEQTAALQWHPLLRGRLQLVLHISSQFLCLHPIFAKHTWKKQKKKNHQENTTPETQPYRTCYCHNGKFQASNSKPFTVSQLQVSLCTCLGKRKHYDDEVGK